MNHPTREDWISYLYREVSNAQRAKLANHLRDCSACAAQIDDWKTTAKELDAFPLPRQAEPARQPAQFNFPRPAIQWAAAALILLGIGFGTGRLTSGMADGKRLRAAIEPAIRQQL